MNQDVEKVGCTEEKRRLCNDRFYWDFRNAEKNKRIKSLDSVSQDEILSRVKASRTLYELILEEEGKLDAEYYETKRNINDWFWAGSTWCVKNKKKENGWRWLTTPRDYAYIYIF